MKLLIAVMIILIVYLALAAQPAGGTAVAGRATNTPVPPTVGLPTVTPGIVPTDMPAYPAPVERHRPKATPSGLQCARC